MNSLRCLVCMLGIFAGLAGVPAHAFIITQEGPFSGNVTVDAVNGPFIPGSASPFFNLFGSSGAPAGAVLNGVKWDLDASLHLTGGAICGGLAALSAEVSTNGGAIIVGGGQSQTCPASFDFTVTGSKSGTDDPGAFSRLGRFSPIGQGGTQAGGGRAMQLRSDTSLLCCARRCVHRLLRQAHVDL